MGLLCLGAGHLLGALLLLVPWGSQFPPLPLERFSLKADYAARLGLLALPFGLPASTAEG